MALGVHCLPSALRKIAPVGFFSIGSLGDFHRLWRQVDHPRRPLALGFGSREHPAATGKIDMAGFDAKRFLRPASGFSGDGNQVFEFLIRGPVEQRLVLGGGNDLLLAAASRLLHVGEGRAVDVALFLGPLQRTLDGCD